MADFDFSLDGFLATQNGIVLQKPVSLAVATPIYTEAQIAGRSGTLIAFTGAYKNRKAEASCYSIYQPSSDPHNHPEYEIPLMDRINAASNFLFSTVGYRRLQFSYDTDHFMKARITNGAEIQQRWEKLNPFRIEWDCMPQRFLTSGEDTTTISTTGGTIENPTSFASQPLILVNGTTGGSGTISINGVTVTVLNIVAGMYLDCEIENCYNNDSNQNDKISADEYPTLIEGTNSIYFTGDISSLVITPRWWEI